MLSSKPPGPTRAWAEFASTVSYDSLPVAVTATARVLIIDTIATMMAGSGLSRASGLVFRMAHAASGAEESSLIGYASRAPVLSAAMVNGATADALNFDALGGGGGHLGVGAVPAPLAMAERKGGVSGRQLLTAVAVGAELVARLYEAVSAAGGDANGKFFDGQLLGYFGAAVGAGSVLGLTPEQMDSALGFALMQATGTGQVSSEGKEAKGIIGTFSNHGGALSALLAAEGIDAACLALEGQRGLYQSFFDDTYDPSVLEAGLGTEFRVIDTRFKTWPTQGTLHPFVEAALQITKQDGFTADDIEHVVVKASPGLERRFCEPIGERRHPSNTSTASNSIFFAVATTLYNGNFSLRDLTEEGLIQEGVMRLADACFFVPQGPQDKDATLEVTFKRGVKETIRVDMSHSIRIRPGHGHVASKFRDCARYAAVPLQEEQIEKTLGMLEHLEDVEDIRTIMECFLPGP